MVGRRGMTVGMVLVGLVVWMGCGSSAVAPEDASLSQVMALTGVRKTELRNADGALIGLSVSVDVINTGPVAIERPFVMTWRLRESNGTTLAQATQRFAGQPFGSAERRPVNLTLRFPARANLSGIQDVVTFHFE